MGMKPKRTVISTKSLLLMGIPIKFHSTTLSDFNTYDTMDNVKSFVEKYMNQLAVDSLFSLRGIFFYGSNGVGKTMLSSLILKEAYACRYTARRCTFVEYISEYSSMWGCKDPDEKELREQNFYTYFKAVEFLCLEEVGKEIDSKIAIPILEDLLRYREDHGLVTIMCSNVSIKAVATKYGASVESLIKGNMIPVLLSGEDKRGGGE